VNGINRYADSWRRHQSLWKTDKGSVLDKFKAREPSNMAFEEKLSKYSKVMHTERRGGYGQVFKVMAVLPFTLVRLLSDVHYARSLIRCLPSTSIFVC